MTWLNLPPVQRARSAPVPSPPHSATDNGRKRSTIPRHEAEGDPSSRCPEWRRRRDRRFWRAPAGSPGRRRGSSPAAGPPAAGGLRGLRAGREGKDLSSMAIITPDCASHGHKIIDPCRLSLRIIGLGPSKRRIFERTGPYAGRVQSCPLRRAGRDGQFRAHFDLRAD